MVKEVKLDKMDELIEALGGGGGGSDIPTPTVQDDGKILSVAGGEYILAETHGGFVPNASSSDDGKVLTAVYDDKSGNCNAEWVTPEDELPEISAQNGGNILMVNVDTSTSPWTRKPEWGKPDMKYSFQKVLASQFTELADTPGTYRYTGISNANSKIIIPIADYITGIGIDSSNTGYIETDSTGYAQLTQDGEMKVIVITLTFAKTAIM